jgi:hypothetical protein
VPGTRMRIAGLGDNGDDDDDIDDSVGVVASGSYVGPVLPEGITTGPSLPTNYDISPGLPTLPSATMSVGDLTSLTGDNTDLAAGILSGSIAPPAGSGLTASEVTSLRNMGADEYDIQDILNGTKTYSQVFFAYAAATPTDTISVQQAANTPVGISPTGSTVNTVAPTSAAASSVAALARSLTTAASSALRPSAITTATINPATGLPYSATSTVPGTLTSSLSSSLAWFSQETIVAGMPNYLVVGGFLAVLGAVGAMAAKR